MLPTLIILVTDLFVDPTCGSPMFGLHSVPLSPTTDALHKERLTPRTKKRRSMFESILGKALSHPIL